MKRYITIIAAATLIAGCVNENLPVSVPDNTTATVVVPEGATAGEVIIKFAPEMEAILDQTMTRAGGAATRSGIPSTDEVLDILGAYSFERVFPVDSANEARTREAGLHLWYIVRFDEGEDMHTTPTLTPSLSLVPRQTAVLQHVQRHGPSTTPRSTASGATSTMAQHPLLVSVRVYWRARMLDAPRRGSSAQAMRISSLR